MITSENGQSNTAQKAANDTLLEALLDSWDRKNTILTNLLRTIPTHALAVRASATSPTIAAQFAHLHYVRLIFVAEDAPEFGAEVPDREWPDDIEQNEMLEL